MEFNKKYFAKRLKELRLAKKLTQENLSEKLGIEPSNYSNFETGKTTPSVQSLYKIMERLDVTPNEVFEYEHLEDEKILDEKILKIYSSLNLSKKRALYKIIRLLEDITKNKI